MDRFDLASHGLGHPSVDAVVLRAHQGLAGELEKDALENRDHKLQSCRVSDLQSFRNFLKLCNSVTLQLLPNHRRYLGSEVVLTFFDAFAHFVTSKAADRDI